MQDVDPFSSVHVCIICNGVGNCGNKCVLPPNYIISRVKKTALTKIDAILKRTVCMLVSILSFNKSRQSVLYM